MLAAYTFGSAEQLTDFCRRHEIGAQQTYSVLQSHVSGVLDGYPYDDFRLTIVLEMEQGELIVLAEEEEAFKAERRRREEAEQQERWRQEEEQREADRQRRWRDAESAIAHRDDIPF